MLGSKMSKWRRYVYLLVDNFNEGTYPLRRIDTSSLFFPRAEEVVPKKVEDARLPHPFVSFAPLGDSCVSGNLDFFTTFGCGNKKSLIAGADEKGFTFMYDLDQRVVHNQVHLNEPKQHDPVSLAVGDALYVMDRSPRPQNRCGFEALVYGHEQPGYLVGTQSWRWHCLPPPPYVLTPGYKPSSISAYTVVGGSRIWISTPDIGTYSFDTSTGTWDKAGEWVLPFHGRADYFPEYNLWLGFSSESRLLCSSDLSTASVQVKPALHGILEDKQVEEGWILNESQLVYLGLGKFCVAKFFETEHYEVSRQGYVPQNESFAVLTGFVMDLTGPGGELRMIRHKSRRYRFQAMTTGWVF